MTIARFGTRVMSETRCYPVIEGFNSWQTYERHEFIGEAGAVWVILLRFRVQQELHTDSHYEKGPKDFEDETELG
jgi:hypothetical protein